jgi:NAD+ synthase (glutamine-hydrolysing)
MLATRVQVGGQDELVFDGSGILQAYIEEDRGLGEIVALGFGPDMIAEVIRMVDQAEYKRRQAPPGVRITPRAIGQDRRLPITNHYRDARP